MKKKLLDTLLETEIVEFNTFTIRDYMKILNRVYEKKKPMFSDFIDSSAKYKVMIYWLLKRIYEDEEIPENFFDTELVALFKKGDQKDPGNYRYLQLKKDLPRLFEMAIYLKIEKTFDLHTPEAQAGGKKQSDTIENLALLMTAIQKAVKEGKGLIATFNDIRKCFDRLYLSDGHWFLLKFGADPKAVKVLTILLGTTRLTLRGSKKSFIVKDGSSQGVRDALRCNRVDREIFEPYGRC